MVSGRLPSCPKQPEPRENHATPWTSTAETAARRHNAWAPSSGSRGAGGAHIGATIAAITAADGCNLAAQFLLDFHLHVVAVAAFRCPRLAGIPLRTGPEALPARPRGHG